MASRQSGGQTICVGCCRKLTEGQSVGCPECRWPMCGRQECFGEGSQHQMGECSLMKAAGDLPVINNFSQGTTEGIYESILILRFLSLQERDPVKFSDLLGFKFRGGSRFSAQPNNRVVSTAVTELLRKWLPNCNIPNEWIVKIYTLFNVYTIEVKLVPTLHDRITEGQHGIFAVYHMIGHSCAANATHSFSKNGQIVVRAAVSISKGEEISVNYLNPFHGTLLRQKCIKQTRFGSCECRRCKDPSELNSFASGIYCSRCPNQEGILLSKNPLDEHSDWICNKCAGRRSITFITSLMKKVSDDVSALNLRSFTEIEGYIHKYAKLLHPNNYFLSSMKLALNGKIQNDMDGLFDDRDNSSKWWRQTPMNDETLKNKQECVVELLKLIDIVIPGVNLRRGVLLFQLYLIMRWRDTTLPKNSAVSFNELYSHYQMSYKILSEVHAIFSLESKGTYEFNMFQYTRGELKKLEDLARLYKIYSNDS